MKYLTLFLVLILILSVIRISGCISFDTANQSSNYLNTQVSFNIRWLTLN